MSLFVSLDPIIYIESLQFMIASPSASDACFLGSLLFFRRHLSEHDHQELPGSPSHLHYTTIKRHHPIYDNWSTADPFFRAHDLDSSLKTQPQFAVHHSVCNFTRPPHRSARHDVRHSPGITSSVAKSSVSSRSVERRECIWAVSLVP